MRCKDRWSRTPWRAIDSSSVIHFEFDERKLQHCGIASLETEILVFAMFARGPTPGFCFSSISKLFSFLFPSHSSTLVFSTETFKCGWISLELMQSWGEYVQSSNWYGEWWFPLNPATLQTPLSLWGEPTKLSVRRQKMGHEQHALPSDWHSYILIFHQFHPCWLEAYNDSDRISRLLTDLACVPRLAAL